MAAIVTKNKRRNRIQLSMSQQLFEAHQQNLETAKEVGATIDFTRDFEKWFSSQTEQVARELERLKGELSPSSSTEKLARYEMQFNTAVVNRTPVALNKVEDDGDDSNG